MEILTRIAVGVSLVALALWVMFNLRRNVVKVNSTVSRRCHKYLAHNLHLMVIVFSTISWLLSLLASGPLIMKSLYTITLVTVVGWDIYDHCALAEPRKLVTVRVHRARSQPQVSVAVREGRSQQEVVVHMSGEIGSRKKRGGRKPLTVSVSKTQAEVTISLS